MSRLRSHEGANAVEFALVLPMLVILIFGAITAGLSLNTRQQMDHAVREGARFAATLPFDDSGNPCGGSDSWWDCVRNRVEGSSVGNVNTTDGGIGVSYIDVDDVASSQRWGTLDTGEADAEEGDPCFEETPALTGARVQVTARMPGTVDGVFFGLDFDLDAKSVSMHEGE